MLDEWISYDFVEFIEKVKYYYIKFNIYMKWYLDIILFSIVIYKINEFYRFLGF